MKTTSKDNFFLLLDQQINPTKNDYFQDSGNTQKRLGDVKQKIDREYKRRVSNRIKR